MTGPSDEVTWKRASARRLHRNGITSPLPLTSSGVVSAMVAAHSQVASAGELSVALRCEGTVDDVRRALWEEHSLIRTYGPRGTVHLLSAAEMRMLGAPSPWVKDLFADASYPTFDSWTVF